LQRSALASVFGHRANVIDPAEPLHCDTPVLRHAEIAAIYLGQRIAGDFYEFLRVGTSRLLFVLLDIAGLRTDNRPTLIALQKTFRTRAPQLFAEEDLNEASAMSELCYAMNRTIMSEGVRSCPAFIACYNEDLGTLCYANAGHMPPMFRDQDGISLLPATGLPLGLFSHTTQSASTCHLPAGSALVVVSSGIVEALSTLTATIEKNVPAAAVEIGSDFGMEKVRSIFEGNPLNSAPELCLAMLRAAQDSAPVITQNADITTLALVRNAAIEPF
jgi:serine phosphatase RsbU (regulator of sigma subunit)